MAGNRSSVTISDDLIRAFQGGGVRKAAAKKIAEIVEEEFNRTLLDAPQFSGNYVANMMLGTSGIARGSAEYPFPKNPDKTTAYRRGPSAAVGHAQDKNAGFVEKATAHIAGKGGWLREIVVYNKLEYASKVEEYGPNELREENRGGEHALAKMADRLERRHALLTMKDILL